MLFGEPPARRARTVIRKMRTCYAGADSGTSLGDGRSPVAPHGTRGPFPGRWVVGIWAFPCGATSVPLETRVNRLGRPRRRANGHAAPTTNEIATAARTATIAVRAANSQYCITEENPKCYLTSAGS